MRNFSPHGLQNGNIVVPSSRTLALGGLLGVIQSQGSHWTSEETVAQRGDTTWCICPKHQGPRLPARSPSNIVRDSTAFHCLRKKESHFRMPFRPSLPSTSAIHSKPGPRLPICARHAVPGAVTQSWTRRQRPPSCRPRLPHGARRSRGRKQARLRRRGEGGKVGSGLLSFVFYVLYRHPFSPIDFRHVSNIIHFTHLKYTKY